MLETPEHVQEVNCGQSGGTSGDDTDGEAPDRPEGHEPFGRGIRWESYRNRSGPDRHRVEAVSRVSRWEPVRSTERLEPVDGTEPVRCRVRARH
ncbi:unnamed protein product [Euphydryas editha]|uniref:Uncharacterized protein n=1 Tax=Euphydryas editha TaxID=104508 RepID=A0AAU9TY70_EUPED|nr:unnamed protein product [Euphydryas editha]